MLVYWLQGLAKAAVASLALAKSTFGPLAPVGGMGDVGSSEEDSDDDDSDGGAGGAVDVLAGWALAAGAKVMPRALFQPPSMPAASPKIVAIGGKNGSADAVAVARSGCRLLHRSSAAGCFVGGGSRDFICYFRTLWQLSTVPLLRWQSVQLQRRVSNAAR